jgi:hypothetical protein
MSSLLPVRSTHGECAPSPCIRRKEGRMGSVTGLDDVEKTLDPFRTWTPTPQPGCSQSHIYCAVPAQYVQEEFSWNNNSAFNFGFAKERGNAWVLMKCPSHWEFLHFTPPHIIARSQLGFPPFVGFARHVSVWPIMAVPFEYIVNLSIPHIEEGFWTSRSSLSVMSRNLLSKKVKLSS